MHYLERADIPQLFLLHAGPLCEWAKDGGPARLWVDWSNLFIYQGYVWIWALGLYLLHRVRALRDIMAESGCAS